MTELRMNPDEYFILTAAREFSVLMRWLNEPQRDEGFNLPDPPDLWGAKLVETLMRLFEGGDIVAQDKADIERPGKLFIPDREQVEAALAGRLTFFYLLTVRGGARWEAAAEVDWDRFVHEGWTPDPEVWAITATTRKAAESYLDRFAISNPFPDDCEVPIESTVQWDVLKPWEATYWKTLPIGHRMTCSVRTVRMPQPDSFGEVRERIQLWTKDTPRWHSLRWFRTPERHESPDPLIDTLRKPWRLFPRPDSAARATHWHFRLSYRRIEFTHHVYWDFNEAVLRSEIYRYDAPDFLPTKVLAADEKPLPHWEAIFELRDHVVRKSVDGSDR